MAVLPEELPGNVGGIEGLGVRMDRMDLAEVLACTEELDDVGGDKDEGDNEEGDGTRVTASNSEEDTIDCTLLDDSSCMIVDSSDGERI